MTTQALGKMWHPEHFLCSDCGADFPDDKFHKIDSRPYCKVCYAIKVHTRTHVRTRIQSHFA